MREDHECIGKSLIVCFCGSLYDRSTGNNADSEGPAHEVSEGIRTLFAMGLRCHSCVTFSRSLYSVMS